MIRQHFIGLLGALKTAALITAPVVVLEPFGIVCEVAVFITAFLFFCVRVKTTLIALMPHKMTVSKGLFLKSNREIFLKSVLCISIVEQPIAKLFSASLVRINTVVAEKGYRELKFMLSKTDALALAQTVFSENTEFGETETPKPLLAAMSSTIAMGVAIGLPIISKIAAFFSRAFVSRNEQKSLSFGENLVVCGTQMLVFKQMYCRRGVLREIKVSQNLFDARRKTCSVKVTARLSRKTCAKVRRLALSEVNSLLQNTECYTHKTLNSANNN